MEPQPEDDELEEDLPQVRPWRMILGSVFGLGGSIGALFSWGVLRGVDQLPEPQGSAAAIGQALMPAVAWVSLAVFAIIAVVSFVTLISALSEARAARQSLRRVAMDDEPVG